MLRLVAEAEQDQLVVAAGGVVVVSITAHCIKNGKWSASALPAGAFFWWIVVAIIYRTGWFPRALVVFASEVAASRRVGCFTEARGESLSFFRTKREGAD